jgi:DNA polymerase-3 subunit alpha
MHYDRGLYFKSSPEIASFFGGRTDVLENTLKIADEVNVSLSKTYHVPAFPLPAGVATENDLLTTLATAGAKELYGNPLPSHVQERLDYELAVILKAGYAGYMLIVWDFIRAARELDIPVGPGRGSAAGSLVAYSLGITGVDPLKFDLLFERFLNPERISMPDVDVDFCFERRGEVIEYVRQKYGRQSVCQIVTFGTMKSRAAIKDVGRTLGFTPAETDALAKLIPNQPNFSLTVKDAVDEIKEVRQLYNNDPRYKQLLDYAISLEGLSRHTGVHAAGVVIAPGPVDQYVPVCTQSSKGAGVGDDATVVVSQYDMNGLEKAGMLKMDFLGLTTLTVLRDAVDSIKARSIPFDLAVLDKLDDAETYRMLRSGRTAGVFQFESGLATDMLRQMRCDRFDDLVAATSLLRPGPLDSGMHMVYVRRKRGDEPVQYALPELQAILEPTFGVITYQEQVMRIAQQLAGISLAEADILRKAVGKKDAVLIKAELGKFVDKAVALGHPRRIIEEIAGQLETFGRYGFNKSHAVAYTVITYHTAYLKTHHPADYMAALLSSCIGDTDSVVKYINEARELGLEILPPDVNESGYKFTVIGDKKVRFGLGAIRNVGKSAIESIIAARDATRRHPERSEGERTIERNPFTSLFDLCARVDLRMCNKRVFEALIGSGALDSLGGHRAQFTAILDTALQEASLKNQEMEIGQGTLFGGGGESADGSSATNGVPTLPNVPPLSETERLKGEKEILGFYTSGHPLEPYRMEAELFATNVVASLGKWTEAPITLAVVITAVKKQISKKSGNEFARLTIEDFSGSTEILVFPEAWTALSGQVRTDLPMLVKGGYSRRDQEGENPTFIVESMKPMAELRMTGQVAIALDLRTPSRLPADIFADVRAVVATHATTHASAPLLELQWSDGSGTRARLRSRSLRIPASQSVLNDLRALLGDERVRLVRGS